MTPIPVDDYAIPHNTPHHYHDIYSITKKHKSLQMLVPQRPAGMHGQRYAANILRDGGPIMGKWEYGGFTFIVIVINTTTSIYHAVRGECNYPTSTIRQITTDTAKSYTGEFIRAMQRVPDDLIPVDGIWPSVMSMERIIGRDLPLYYTVTTMAHRWGVTNREAYRIMFKNRKDAPDYNTAFHILNGYTILKVCGKI